MNYSNSQMNINSNKLAIQNKFNKNINSQNN